MGSVDDDSSLVEQGLLQDEESRRYTGDGSVDFKGRPVLKENTGNWRACPFILGNECCERLAYYGIATNLVTYLTTKLHEGNVSAARNVTTWQGTCYLTPLIGAVLADAYWGRYWTIAGFSMIYFIGMCTLTLSASVPALKPAECVGSICPSATPSQYAVFFFGLYMIALGTGGIKPCVSSFGADQFDDTDSQERIKKGSFFNWFYFSINIGALVSSSLIVWIQENRGWGLGFGIPALFMGLAIGSFFIGTPLYRFQKPGGSPLTRMCQVVVASFQKRNLAVPEDSSLLYETPEKTSAIEGSRKLGHSDELSFVKLSQHLNETLQLNSFTSLDHTPTVLPSKMPFSCLNEGGRTENLDPHVPSLGYWNHFCSRLCPDVNIVCGTRNNDGHHYWLLQHSSSFPLNF
nr:protein NRT1/ PTR FAMILY 8.3 isoform X2 [Arachis hypogaea]